MDQYIERFDVREDGDLMLCLGEGVAYQKDMSHRVEYDDAYFDKYVGYEDAEIANKINAGRIGLVNHFVGPEGAALDIGIGSGEFIKKRPNTFGFDVNPKAIEWLRANRRWSNTFGSFDAFTFWDVLEHVDTPASYFNRMHKGAYVFVSIPIFRDLRRIRDSRHYRPGEHLYYFTEEGFRRWMWRHGFSQLVRQDYETRAGRDSILSFAFRLEN